MATKFTLEDLRARGFVTKPDGSMGRQEPGVRPVEVPSTRRELATTPKERMQALGRLAPGRMNKTEQAYADLLAQSPGVLRHDFEPLKFRLADNTFYTPDFMVQTVTGHLEIHEVKGYWTDDARVKIKVAAEKYPMFTWVAVKRGPKAKGRPWLYEYFK